MSERRKLFESSAFGSCGELLDGVTTATRPPDSPIQTTVPALTGVNR